tara:strand:- start:66191 stop:66967 length:777 start_codon:yes stop_codon:yes gene_type:complete
MSLDTKINPPYSSLADIYDEVMSDVDYETWADYIDEIIITHNPSASQLLELACGTGTIALSLEELDCYEITATDGSTDMIRVAKEKGASVNSEVHFEVMDFNNINSKNQFDVVYLIFDSINYLREEELILKLHHDVKKILAPNGIFIYDFTTPRNSRKAVKYLDNDTHIIGNKYKYQRESSYDAKSQIHTNVFQIEQLKQNGDAGTDLFKEIHQQKIYSQEYIRSIIEKTEFTILEAYDGFQLLPAHKNSLRITMVLQ